ncbi:putative two-component sensor kinase [Vallitalea longa]|uniref:Two-component sensor kinase n=1 Tax=Vallitalea longa TaxID=2936439 RepID=A0A9W6DHH3_9FIRM|nr:sensor histidine kinase [Vallitalea longa]GKX30859.1 putative two-component sensor kinase [Vallitalea longa]
MGKKDAKKHSITKKYFLNFIIIIVIPVLLISFFLNMAYKNIFVDHYSEMVLQTMEQMSIRIQDELNNVSLKGAMIGNDSEIINLVSMMKQSEAKGYRLDLSNQINSKINSLINCSDDIYSVIFFYKGGGHYYFKSPLKENEETVRKESWYKKAIQNRGRIIMPEGTNEMINTGLSQKQLLFTMSPDILGDQNQVEVVCFVFMPKSIDTIYAKFQNHRMGTGLLINKDNDIIVASNSAFSKEDIKEYNLFNKDYIEKSYNNILFNNKKSMVYTYFTNNKKWLMVNIIDYNLLTSEMNQVMLYFVLIYVVIVCLFVIFAVFFIKDIVSPIKQLISKMKSVQKGNFDDRIVVEGSLEIVEMGESFNIMVSEINKLMIERDIQEKEKSKEEIKALQAQIQPHFIYNTLTSIRLMAMIAKVDGIKNMTDAFMNLLSALFKQNNSLVTVNQELEYLNNYLYIMKVRFDELFTVAYDISDEIKSLHMIKLTLQPLIENAIHHGLSKVDRKGIIKVSGYIKEDYLIFDIEDNGIGIEKERIHDIINNQRSEDKKSFNHIGVYNVMRRIKLNHGERYGITIKSEYMRYTKVTVTLPIIGEGEEK